MYYVLFDDEHVIVCNSIDDMNDQLELGLVLYDFTEDEATLKRLIDELEQMVS